MDATGKVNYSLWGKPVVLDTAVDMMFCMSPIWMAIAVGLIVGWSWKPRWVSLILLGLRSRPRLVWETPPGFGARRFWLAMTAVSALPMLKDACVKFSAWMWPSSQNSAAAYDFTEHPQNLPNWWVLFPNLILTCIFWYQGFTPALEGWAPLKSKSQWWKMPRPFHFTLQ